MPVEISWEILRKIIHYPNETGSRISEYSLYLVSCGQDNDLFEVIRKAHLSNCLIRKMPQI